MNAEKKIAVVGLGAILPDADDVASFWKNILAKKDSIAEVPSDRWNVALYYDPDPKAVDKSYCKIGAFVKGYAFNPLKNGIAIPPRVLAEMDQAQQWAIAASLQALNDYGYPSRKLDNERVAVIFGNANAGERHYRSTLRILLPETLAMLKAVPDFNNLPEAVQEALTRGLTQNMRLEIPEITEDTMPGELSNIIAGRVANVFNFSGPNFVTDAACASSMAALQEAVNGLQNSKFDAVLTGGIDRNMGPESYVKFSKIGALSADGSRPYAEGANGFVMGEGAVVFLLKRLEDAEKDGDKIYAIIRGIGGSSDGKGKGITAPNPLGQQRAITRAWQDAGVALDQVGLIEGHGTSTKVGDVAEVGSLNTIFGTQGLRSGSIALGSVKSNIGHLKSAAGAVGLLKTILALHHQVLPPSANFNQPNSSINFSEMPFRVETAPEEWNVKDGHFRFAGVSAFGFGGTNFHVVLEEYSPAIARSDQPILSIPLQVTKTIAEAIPPATPEITMAAEAVNAAITADDAEIHAYVLATVAEKTGYPVEMLDLDLDLEADLGIDTVKQAELFATVRTHYGIPRREDLHLSEYNTLAKVIQFVKDARNYEIPVERPGNEPAAPVQVKTVPSSITEGNQKQEEIAPYQGLFFVSAESAAGLKVELQQRLEQLRSEQSLQSSCPRPAELARSERLAIDYANSKELPKKIEKVLAAFDSENTLVWKALQAHGIYRGSGKPGKVAFLFPGQGSQYVNMLLDLRDKESVVRDTFDEADRVMTPLLGRSLTSFIYTDGGEEAIKQAEQELKNTAITQPAMLTADIAMMRVLNKYGIKPDMVIGHSLGEYAALVAANVLTFAEALEVVSARGREMTRIKVEDNGCMAAVSAPLELVEETIRSIDDYLVIANINSPLQSVLGGNTAAIDAAISKFQAAGFQAVKIPVSHAFHTHIVAPASGPLREVIARMDVKSPTIPIVSNVTGEIYLNGRDEILDLLAKQVASPVQFVKGMQTLYDWGARIFIESGPKRVLNALAAENLKDREDVTIIATNHPRKGGKASFNEALCAIYAAGIPAPENAAPAGSKLTDEAAEIRVVEAAGSHQTGIFNGSVVITGAGLGLPGRGRHVFDDGNIASILNGEMRIEALSEKTRQDMLEKHVTRLIKSEAGAVLEEVTDLEDILKLAGQGGAFDLTEEFGVPEERVDSLDAATKLAMAAGIEALRDAGIPLVMQYRKTTRGTYLPDRWKLPISMQDETGVIFGSAFPGLNRMADEADRFYENKMLQRQLQEVNATIEMVNALAPAGQTNLQNDLRRRAIELETKIKENDYHLDRKFIFRVLSMGHSQFAEYIGARGPNAHANAACATTTHAMTIAEDWIRTGRCRRVVVLSGDDVTNETLAPWIGTSLFASGAATTEGDLRMAALPFDRRRNGLIMGMGAAALVVESEDAARERGVRGIGEILATHTANSAFHGTRLDVDHVSQVMERLLNSTEERYGIRRDQIAKEMVFMSHETYTPARGGSASAEIHALRQCFRDSANQIVIANTKGFTGHSMGVGIEDVVAVKALETGKVPPIANIGEGFEPDPELGDLNLSRGGDYHPQFALRLGAGFGSQIAMTLMRRIPGTGERIDHERHNRWLAGVSGYDTAELEVVQRTLRVKAQGFPAHEPVQSTWNYGDGPSLWANGIPEKKVNFERPVSMSVISPSHEENLERDVRQEMGVDRVGEQIQPTGSDFEAIKAHVLQVVSEKTGYPIEMLDLGLDLEADLGIDTVKQAELFAAVRTYYGIPRNENLFLAEYNTLSKVIQFVQDNLAPLTALSDMKVEKTEVQQVSETIPVAAVREEIKEHVLNTVSEKTGYPVEMLDLELDLEADLGIDTVKQAEFFASIRSYYGIPRREDLILAEYNTLAKVIGFVEDSLQVEASSVLAAEAVSQSKMETELESPVSAPSSDEELAGDELHTIHRRIPTAVPMPRLELCEPTGVELNGKKVLVVRDQGRVGKQLKSKLKDLGAVVLVCKPSELTKSLVEWSPIDEVAGAYDLSSLDADPTLAGDSAENWKSVRTLRAETLYLLARALPEKAFLIGATRMGGLHGLDGTKNPMGGLTSGFIKALHRERPQQILKAVDFGVKDTPAEIVNALMAETLNDKDSVEIGHQHGMRFGSILQESEFQAVAAQPVYEGSVFVISGGTGGITGSVIRNLARSGRHTYYILGRMPLDANLTEDAQKLKRDRNAFRLELQSRLASEGEKTTPVRLEQKIAAIERADETLRLMDAVKTAGGKAHYLVCDVTAEPAVQQAVEQIKAAEGHIDVFIHAAGMEHSRKIENKPLEEFQQVISVKADGLANFLTAFEKAACMPSKFVFFSSLAGRFGNSGQTDYSAANDFLSKAANWLPLKFPGLQAVSIDWGAWSEVGMASRGNIPALMAGAGIEMVSPAAAAPMVLKEIERGESGEVVIAGRLGELDHDQDLSCGLDVARADEALRSGDPIHLMFSHLTSFHMDRGITLEEELDPDHLSYLKDHAINGTPVLPGVIGIEGFYTAAKHISTVLASGPASFEVDRLEDIQFLAPFKFYGNKSRSITWRAIAYKQEENLKIRVTLESDAKRWNGEIQHMLYFSGWVYLSQNKPELEVVSNPPRWSKKKSVSSEEIYNLYFHGPSFQVLDAAQMSGNIVLGRFNKKLANGSADDPALFTTPLLIELCFQTAGLWQAGATDVLALPQSVGSLRIYPQPLNGVAIFAEVKPTECNGKLCFDARVVDEKGNVFLELSDYQTSPMPYSAEKNLVEPLKILVPEENS